MKMATHYGSTIRSKSPLGYSGGQFLFGFFYNVPDNTLPIFWVEDEKWKPILPRYDKTDPGGYDSDGRFF